MENKYYTPELSELHIGFEVEKAVYISTGRYPSPRVLDSWEKATINHPIMMSICSWGAFEFRVKYLDREDIEECGFTYTGKSIDSWFIKEGLFEIGSWTSYCIRLHYGEHDHRMVISAMDLNEEVILFQGNVKNKTEFKKVIKMLGI